MTNYFKKAVLIVFLLQAISLSGYYKAYTIPGSSVKLVCGVESDMFPPSWRGGRINGKAVGFTRNMALQKLELFKREMSRYPASVLQQNLRKIYILKKLSFYGKGYGGTYLASKRAIYIAARFSDQYVKRLIHAEFSSVLLKKYSRHFSKSSWRALNKPGTSYGSGGINALVSGKASTRYSEFYFKQGFLYQYGKAAVEEDFNSFSGNIFGRRKEFWNAVNNYKIIRKKFLYTVAFYNKINPRFTVKYFTTMAGKTLKKMSLGTSDSQSDDSGEDDSYDDNKKIDDSEDETDDGDSTSACSFTGTWKTRWGRMVLVQKQDQVSGHYGSKGKLKGTIRDGKLYFRWTEGESWGKGYFKLSANGKKFNGNWGYKSSQTSGGSWYGIRLK